MNRPHHFGAFAGILGFELGFTTLQGEPLAAAVSEVDPAALAVIKAHHPEIPNLGDIRAVDPYSHTLSKTEVVCAGFPCTDLSQAGRKHGLYGNQSVLAFELLRIIAVRRAPVVVLENVPAMLSRGKGRAMQDLVAAFERLGYRWAYRTVDARAFGLPQRRRRVLFVFALEGSGVVPEHVLFADDQDTPAKPSVGSWARAPFSFSWTEGKAGVGAAFDCTGPLRVGSGFGIPSPPAIVDVERPVGEQVFLPDVRDAERLQGFDEDWTRPAEDAGLAKHRWKLVGRAVPPVMAGWVACRLRYPGQRTCSLAKAWRPGSWPKAAFGGGGKRQGVVASEFPVHMPSPGLLAFLRHRGTPLSPRATRGFLKRLTSGTLALSRQTDFIDTLERHAAAA